MRGRLAFAALVLLIALAHVGLWRSSMPPDLKWKLTLLNGIGWSAVFLPALGVWLWANKVARRRRNVQQEPGGQRHIRARWN